MKLNFHFIRTGRAILMVCVLFVLPLLIAPSALLSEDPPKKPVISNPGKFKVDYNLQKRASSGGPKFGAPGLSSGETKADVAVNILDERFMPVRAFVLRAVKLGQRMESLWDGRDVYGKEMPAGSYYASLSILYTDGSKETKFFRFSKE